MNEEQYVVFKLNKEEYGVNIMDVNEIIHYEGSTSIPGTSEFTEGVISYRGKVTPVINLKKTFSMKDSKTESNSRVIITKSKEREIGFIVDEVSQIVRLNDESIDSPPSTFTNNEDYIIGIGKLQKGKLLVVLDVEKLLSKKEAKKIKK